MLLGCAVALFAGRESTFAAAGDDRAIHNVRMHLRTLTRITVAPRALTCADMCAATCKRHI